ncbi:MAG: hypothetical protein ABL951_00135 [Alphaproteobacteria bacterium]
MQFYVKDPGAVLDYSIDWGGGYLQGGETLSSSIWTIFPGDMTQSAAGNTASVATVTVTGGVAGQIYQMSNRITTSQGRTDERSITVRVEQR